jgi:tRNA U34 5-methylaminomethyl-2-thiouridine-forming methyltransferase MnmC
MNFSYCIENASIALFNSIHDTTWEREQNITPNFTLHKQKMFIQELSFEDKFDLVYFDVFGSRVQPELWTVSIFLKIFIAMKKGGILVTYACKIPIKKAMEEAGFTVEKLLGPPGKREMLRAIKK